ncbi:site-specific DNA-methyltransferase [Tabrizicola sp.]|uniref:site-specific DNA-methyltransferase n=1 Tax=Tabrizicola sp. TaxID=2005166 RepID=UPI00286C94FA|nr:site-specific DNA-methyltransferase [Tabrizicola sp.]
MTEIEKLTAGHPDTQSADIVAGNIEALRALFPEALTEGKIDFEVLKQCLGGAVDEREEKYGLNWHGKRRARQIALMPSTGTLLPCFEDSVDWDTTQNLMIEGDNLEVLKLLQKSYAGTVKLIYIDPPYNTGKDFVYPDDFSNSIANYLALTGQVEGGRKISSNSESSGRFHTDWLNMMYPRLRLAKSLLASDGVIFVSCDDHEAHNLRLLLDDIMGEECFVAQIANVNNLKGRNDRAHIATAHEHLLMYAQPDFESLGLPLSSKQLSEYRNSDEAGLKFQWRDLRKRGGADTRAARPNLYFPVFVDPASGDCSMEQTDRFSVAAHPKKSDGSDGCWRWGKAKIAAEVKNLKGSSTSDSRRWNVSYRVYLEADGEERVAKPKSVWMGPELSTDTATKTLKAIVPGADNFTPKPVELMKLIAHQSLGEGDLALDFFAGSGTLGHAVMELNAQDSGARRFILVQLPEPTGRDDYPTIAELTKERLRRAGAAVKRDFPSSAGDTGFRAFKLASSNIIAWEPDTTDFAGTLLAHAEHLVPDRTEADILTELLLKLGLDLCVPIKTKDIAGKSIHAVGAGALIVCLSDGITREVVEGLAQGIVAWWQALAPAGDTRVVFKDSAFADDVAKTNMAAILNQAGIKDMRSL